ncbi:hypothetical protein COL940_009464 [Colletotrichum noveboracense]|nr:hypothetical protein COL940_009464 [Colletotrichum noveboracense]
MDGDGDAADAGGGMTMISSQASSHFPLEPVSADVLLRRETKRRDALKKRGPVRVGCREVDEYVLMGGGLERGSVVGVSAESEQMGLMAVATELCGSEGEADPSRAMVVTAQPPAAILPALRDAVKAELAARGVTGAEVRGRLVSCLERVSITRVFDLEGLWEVLGDLDIPPESPGSEAASLVPEMEEDPKVQLASQGQQEEVASPEPERITLPDLKPVYESPQRRPVRTEIADSEEEDDISDGEDGDVSDGKDNDIIEDKDEEAPAPSSSELSDLSPPPSSMASMLATPDPVVVPEDDEKSDSHEDPGMGDFTVQEEKLPTPLEQPVADQHRRSRSPRMEAEPPAPPDIILITHFSTLMTALFTGRDRASAHDGLQSLSAFLRYLSRSLSSSPLIMLLNSTSSSKSKTLTEPPPIPPSEAPPPPDERSSSGGSKPLAATLRSVFNPPQLDIPGYAGHAAARRNKPTFGLVFAQLLDLHLLCTKVPRTREDAERLYAPPDRGDGGGGGVRYTWVVEVLLDELGVWEEGAAHGVRRCREQRWTAVDVRAGRVVDAFEGAEGRPKNVGDVRVVGGFGGPRV